MSVRETSLAALSENKVALGRDQQVIYELLIEQGPMSDNMMLDLLRAREMGKPAGLQHKWEKSDITGRRNQLCNKGLVDELGAFFGWVNIRGVNRIKKHIFWKSWNDNRPAPHGWYDSIEKVPGVKLRVKSEKLKVKETLF